MADPKDIYGVVFDGRNKDDVSQIKFNNISISEGYFNGVKFFPRDKEIVISQSQNNVNVKNLYESHFGNSSNFNSGNLTIRVKNGVTIGSTDVSKPALTVPNFGSSLTTITLIVESGASILGKGGKGGDGYNVDVSGYPVGKLVNNGIHGRAGGVALSVARNCIIQNHGKIAGGGGGGGAGGAFYIPWGNESGEAIPPVACGSAGGGGGAGAIGGDGGLAPDNITSGRNWVNNSLVDPKAGGDGTSVLGGKGATNKRPTSQYARSDYFSVGGDGGGLGGSGKRGDHYGMTDGNQVDVYSMSYRAERGEEKSWVSPERRVVGVPGNGGKAGYAVVGSKYINFIEKGEILGSIKSS